MVEIISLEYNQIVNLRLRGLEPPAFGSGIQRSIQMSYRRIYSVPVGSSTCVIYQDEVDLKKLSSLTDMQFLLFNCIGISKFSIRKMSNHRFR